MGRIRLNTGETELFKGNTDFVARISRMRTTLATEVPNDTRLEEILLLFSGGRKIEPFKKLENGRECVADGTRRN